MRDPRLTDLERRLEAACNRRGYTRGHLRAALVNERFDRAAVDAYMAMLGLEAAARQGAAAFAEFAKAVETIGGQFERGERR